MAFAQRQDCEHVHRESQEERVGQDHQEQGKGGTANGCRSKRGGEEQISMDLMG